ncbi:MAG TPA: hypothetical protein VKA55_08615 [Gammaproteobacteria bacterium]|nr:hypothetical protein [Gammaproteobacteria bacterium]
MAYRSSDASEALTAASDVVTLLRLAADNAQMVRDRVHGETYDGVDELLHDISELYRRAEDLEGRVEAYVTERGHRR